MEDSNKIGRSDNLPTHVHYLLHWAQKSPNREFLIQPLPTGEVIKFTWQQVADEVKRMAAYLQAMNLPQRSQIAIFGKNSAHWIMADLAIWMSGHISVPLYTTLNADGTKYVLEHSESKVLFIGKLDGVGDSWNEVKGIIPNDMPCIRLPLAPDYDAITWDDIVAKTQPTASPYLPQA